MARQCDHLHTPRYTTPQPHLAGVLEASSAKLRTMDSVIIFGSGGDLGHSEVTLFSPRPFVPSVVIAIEADRWIFYAFTTSQKNNERQLTVKESQLLYTQRTFVCIQTQRKCRTTDNFFHLIDPYLSGIVNLAYFIIYLFIII